MQSNLIIQSSGRPAGGQACELQRGREMLNDVLTALQCTDAQTHDIWDASQNLEGSLPTTISLKMSLTKKYKVTAMVMLWYWHTPYSHELQYTTQNTMVIP